MSSFNWFSFLGFYPSGVPARANKSQRCPRLPSSMHNDIILVVGEIGRNGNIYATEISKCYTAEFYPLPQRDPVVKHLPAHQC